VPIRARETVVVPKSDGLQASCKIGHGTCSRVVQALHPLAYIQEQTLRCPVHRHQAMTRWPGRCRTGLISLSFRRKSKHERCVCASMARVYQKLGNGVCLYDIVVSVVAKCTLVQACSLAGYIQLDSMCGLSVCGQSELTGPARHERVDRVVNDGGVVVCDVWHVGADEGAGYCQSPDAGAQRRSEIRMRETGGWRVCD
jgi:hypothetical protein